MCVRNTGLGTGGDNVQQYSDIKKLGLSVNGHLNNKDQNILCGLLWWVGRRYQNGQRVSERLAVSKRFSANFIYEGTSATYVEQHVSETQTNGLYLYRDFLLTIKHAIPRETD